MATIIFQVLGVIFRQLWQFKHTPHVNRSNFGTKELRNWEMYTVSYIKITLISIYKFIYTVEGNITALITYNRTNAMKHDIVSRLIYTYLQT
jgi:hypothetical protein